MPDQNRVSAIVGDITQADTDAIVNAANNELWMGSGVAGAIKRAGGEEIEREAVRKGPIDVGGAVATSAGNLPHKRVIHAAAMGFQGGSMIPAMAESIRQATDSALQVADQEGMTSIAFPALGTGVGGFSIEECAGIMVPAVVDHLNDHAESGIIHVVFVLRDEQARLMFNSVIGQSRAGS
jgi:O-acetyl-ADP-ribose deacetylase